MTRWTRLPIRLRLTITFAAGLAAVVAGLGVFVYVRAAADLLTTVDAGLSSRAELLVGDLQHRGPALIDVEPSLIDSGEVFAQIATPAGQILQSTSGVSRRWLLPPAQIGAVRAAAFHDRRIPGVDNVARVLAVPVATAHGRYVVMVGASLQDRQDELDQLGASVAAGGIAAVLLGSVCAWLVLARALAPVERMRREAAAISATDTRRRLSPGNGRDEIAALGATLNQMLSRIQESVRRERQLVDRASHELRTPLAVQRMDLDLALAGPQTARDLAAALRSVSAENAHLTRLTQDLLVLSRARDGQLPIRREQTSMPELLADDARLRPAQSGGAQVSYRADAELVCVDPVWLRQAIGNLIDNALRHTPAGGLVTVSATRHDGEMLVAVEDTGSGFAEEALSTVFEPFASARPTTAPEPAAVGLAAAHEADSTGLGLAVVRMIAEAHDGRVWAENTPAGGARVTIAVPAEPR
jgi:two-component system OmpR family sensor kinase